MDKDEVTSSEADTFSFGVVGACLPVLRLGECGLRLLDKRWDVMKAAEGSGTVKSAKVSSKRHAVWRLACGGVWGTVVGELQHRERSDPILSLAGPQMDPEHGFHDPNRPLGLAVCLLVASRGDLLLDS